MKLYKFRTVPLSIIRSFSLYTKKWYMLYYTGLLTACEQDQDGMAWSCSQAISKTVLHIPLLCVQWKTPDDGQRNCPKRVEFHCKYKFEKLVHLVGFIVRIYHDARSPERQFWSASSPLCWFNNKEFFVCYTYSRTQLYFTYLYSRNTTTCFGPICGPSSPKPTPNTLKEHPIHLV